MGNPAEARSGRARYLGAMKPRYLAVVFLATALAGFGPSYVAKQAALSSLAPWVHVHAGLFAGWLVLLIAQTWLVGARRVDLHRTLGVFGVVLAAGMLLSGATLALASARSRTDLTAPAVPELLLFQFGALALFAVFLLLALWQRRRSPTAHQRLMLLATIAILPPALARLPLIGVRPVLALLASLLFVVAGVAYDLRTRGRPHPVYVLGGLALLISGPLRFALSQTSAWHAIARSLIEHT